MIAVPYQLQREAFSEEHGASEILKSSRTEAVDLRATIRVVVQYHDIRRTRKDKFEVSMAAVLLNGSDAPSLPAFLRLVAASMFPPTANLQPVNATANTFFTQQSL